LKHEDHQTFNTKIQKDLFKHKDSDTTILSITDESTRHATATIIPDNNAHTIAKYLNTHLFITFGLPAAIYFKKERWKLAG
jgi:hypothetical protein